MNFKEMRRRLEEGEDPLELSIEKWKDIVHHLEAINGFSEYDPSLEDGMDNCALCYAYNWGSHECEDCPVYHWTGHRWCCRTPFETYQQALKMENVSWMLMCAKDELEFLESLREEDPQ